MHVPFLSTFHFSGIVAATLCTRIGCDRSPKKRKRLLEHLDFLRKTILLVFLTKHRASLQL
jgi:hypothetical protein